MIEFGAYVCVPSSREVVDVPSPNDKVNCVKLPVVCILYFVNVPDEALLDTILNVKLTSGQPKSSNIIGISFKLRILQSNVSWSVVKL
jgi:hypothetical protein